MYKNKTRDLLTDPFIKRKEKEVSAILAECARYRIPPNKLAIYGDDKQLFGVVLPTVSFPRDAEVFAETTTRVIPVMDPGICLSVYEAPCVVEKGKNKTKLLIFTNSEVETIEDIFKPVFSFVAKLTEFSHNLYKCETVVQLKCGDVRSHNRGEVLHGLRKEDIF